MPRLLQPAQRPVHGRIADSVESRTLKRRQDLVPIRLTPRDDRQHGQLEDTFEELRLIHTTLFCTVA